MHAIVEVGAGNAPEQATSRSTSISGGEPALVT